MIIFSTSEMIGEILLLFLLVEHSNPLKIGVNLPHKKNYLFAGAIDDALNSTYKNSEYELFYLSDTLNQTCVDLILDIGHVTNQSNEYNQGVARVSILDQYSDLIAQNSNNMIVFRSPSASLLRLIPMLISHHELRKVLIFYDTSINLENSSLNELFDSNNTYFGSMFMNFNKSDELAKYLRKQKRATDMSYFVVGKARSINLLLDLVQQNELFRAYAKWFVLTKSTNRIKCSSCSHSTITLIRPIISNLHEYENPPQNGPSKCSEDYYDYHFYYDLTRLALQAAGSFNLHNKSCEKSVQKFYHSNLFVENFLNQSEAYFGRFGGYHVEPRMALNDDQRFMASYQEVNYEVIELRKTFKKSEKSKKMLIQYGEPSPQIIKTSLLQSDDEGDKINVVTLIQPPFVMKRTSNGSSDVEYYGFLVDIFDEIRKELGTEFPEYEIVEDESGLYGISNDAMSKGVKEEITWTGIAASFEEEDGGNYFGLVAMTIAGSRDLIMDFSEPIFDYVGIIALMRKPDFQDHFFVYATVLERNVWLCILGAYLLTSVVIAVFDYYSPYSMRYVKDKIEDDENEGDDRVFTLKESLWFCFTSLTPQGGGEGPRALSGRLVTATWWLFGFIVVASYTANLAAFLTVSRLDRNIQSFDDLTIQYKVRYSPVEGTATARHFEMLAMNEERFYEVWKDLSLNDSMTDEERARLAVWEYPVGDRFTKIWAQMNEIEKPTSFEGAIRKIRDSPSPREGFGLVGEAPSLQWIQMFSCDMIVVGPEFAFRPVAFPIKKGDPLGLKKKIDPILKKMKEDGRLDAFRLKYWDRSLMTRKCRDYRKLSDGITLRNSGGLFIIIGVCLFSTLLALSLENMIVSYFMQFEVERNELKSQGANKKKNIFRRTWNKYISWLKS